MHTSARTLFVGTLLIGALGAGAGCSSTTASSQFCGDSAKKQCHRAYTCTPAAMQDDAFHMAWGPSEDKCAAGLAMLCDGGCMGKTAVDEGAKTMCLSQIDSSSCEVILAGDPPPICGSVCIVAPMGGGGVSGGGGVNGGGGMNGSGGAGGAGGPPIGETAFCMTAWQNNCVKAFQCVPVADQTGLFTALFGANVTECNGRATAVCATSSCTTFNMSLVSSCLTQAASQSCTDFNAGTAIPACDNACTQ